MPKRIYYGVHWAWAKGGRPPDNHPRQCQSNSKVARRRCRKWALKNRKYCQHHGGRQKAVSEKGMPHFYSKSLGPTLKAKFEALLESTYSEQLSLFEELAIARVMAEQSLGLLTNVVESKDKRITDNAKQLALVCVQESLEHVRDMAVAASKIDKEGDGKVSIAAVTLITVQITRAIFRVCGEEHKDIAVRIEKALATEVRLPTDRADLGVRRQGVDMLPEFLQLMDQTVVGERVSDNGNGKQVKRV